LSKFNLIGMDLRSFIYWGLAIFFVSKGALFSSKAGVFAQNLTLFEDIEVTRAGDRVGDSRRNNAGDIMPKPVFTLVGTARFGDHYSTVINDGNEVNILLDEIPGSIIPIPGYPQYQVIGISSGEVLIKYPADMDCVASKEEGISCNEANIATLRLTNAQPIIPSIVSEVRESTDEQNAPRNPFAALLEESSNSDASAEEPDRFTPRRINPEDVPPGMRVVSTPFGDRLVEE